MAPRYGRQVVVGEPVVPEPTGAVAGFDVATVEAWVEPQRSALVELIQVLKTTEAEAEVVERDLAAAQAGGVVEAPTALLTTHLDVMLARAMVELDGAVTAARIDAAAIVTAATQEAAALLASVGADATKVIAAEAETVARPHLMPLLRRPRSAIELRREVAVEVRRLPTPLDTARPPAPLGWLVCPEEPGAALGPEVANWEEGQVNELFWRSVPADGAARQLIRLARG